MGAMQRKHLTFSLSSWLFGCVGTGYEKPFRAGWGAISCYQPPRLPKRPSNAPDSVYGRRKERECPFAPSSRSCKFGKIEEKLREIVCVLPNKLSLRYEAILPRFGGNRATISRFGVSHCLFLGDCGAYLCRIPSLNKWQDIVRS